MTANSPELEDEDQEVLTKGEETAQKVFLDMKEYSLDEKLALVARLARQIHQKNFK